MEINPRRTPCLKLRAMAPGVRSPVEWKWFSIETLVALEARALVLLFAICWMFLVSDGVNTPSPAWAMIGAPSIAPWMR